MERSPFAILGTTPDVSLPELKRIYRRLVRQWHPDRFHGDPVRQREAKERLSLINGAYRDCLALIAERQTSPLRSSSPVVHPHPHFRSRPGRSTDPPPRPAPPPLSVSPRWPHAAAAALFLLAWLASGRRYPDDLLFRVGFILLFTLIPAATGLWSLLGLVRGRIAVLLYAGSTLVSLASLLAILVLDSRRTFTTVIIPADRGDAGSFVGSGRYPPPPSPLDLPPPSALTPPDGPVPPVVPVPAAPASPAAPIPPTAPAAPAAR